MESLPSEIVLYMCDVSSFNYMYLYRLNKYFYSMLRVYKKRMLQRYIHSVIARKKEAYEVFEAGYGVIDGQRNGPYSHHKTVYPRILYRGIVDVVKGAYRDSAKHGVWEKQRAGVVLHKCVFCFGKIVTRYNFNAVDGTIRNIIHYDEHGMIKGEYPNAQMTIHYRSGVIEEQN